MKPIRIIGNIDINTSDIKKSNSFIDNNKSLPKINKNKITILLGKDTKIVTIFLSVFERCNPKHPNNLLNKSINQLKSTFIFKFII